MILALIVSPTCLALIFLGVKQPIWILCERMMEACLHYGDVNSDTAIGFLTYLRRFRAHLHHEELLHCKQTTLDCFFPRVPPYVVTQRDCH